MPADPSTPPAASRPPAAPPLDPAAADSPTHAPPSTSPRPDSPEDDARTPAEYTETPGRHRRPSDGAALDVGG